MKLYRINYSGDILLIDNKQLTEVTEDDETMWCFAHSREPDSTPVDGRGTCIFDKYRGDCDVALGHIFRYTE